MNKYETGNVVRTQVTITDEDDALVDPEALEVQVTDPNEETTTYVFGTDSEVSKLSTGVYRVALVRTIVGEYTDKWVSTNPTGAKSRCVEMVDGCSDE